MFGGIIVANPFKELTKSEWIIYIISLTVVLVAGLFSQPINYVNLAGSLVGVTALIFISKGDPKGQALMVVFGVLYSITAISYRYYSEIITYLGMTVPLALTSFFTWVKNPFETKKNQVKIRALTIKEGLFAIFLTSVVTFVFYFILKALNTSNLVVSTFSIATSFIASYFMIRRITYYAIAFMLNDVVLIVLWVLATVDNLTYLSVVACFAVFLMNDLHSFIKWRIREKAQGLRK
ncbi:MAG: nicotinamide mononucleotide transporter [Clostridia bacterium]|nr:nicotinamide mononucleotide transporter [Clostridia bacterium]